MTHRTEVLKRFGIPLSDSPSLADLAKLSGYKLKDLVEIYERGRGAWKTNIASVRLKSDFSKNPDVKRFPRSSRLSAENWGFARVYAFINKSPTFYGPDSDIAKKY